MTEQRRKNIQANVENYIKNVELEIKGRGITDQIEEVEWHQARAYRYIDGKTVEQVGEAYFYEYQYKYERLTDLLGTLYETLGII